MRLLRSPQLEGALLVLLIGFALWPIWGYSYFLTNDGPCHLYNAGILRDMLLGRNTELWASWYSLNSRLDPNWLCHIILMALQLVMSPNLAEKVFLSTYVIGFVLGFRYLARSIHWENGSLAFLALPFVYNKVLLFGFFNFALSIAIVFFVWGFWLRHRDSGNWRHWLALSGLLLLLLFTHAMGYTLGVATIACHGLAEWLLGLGAAGRKQAHRAFLRKLGFGLLAALPSIILFLVFLSGQDTTAVPSQVKLHKLYHDFIELRSLVLFHNGEAAWPIVLSVVIGVGLVVGLVRMRRGGWRHEGLLLMWVVALYMFFNQPATVGRAAIMPERLQAIPFLLVLAWLACQKLPFLMRKGAVLAGIVVTVMLLVLRLPNHALTSAAVEEWMTAANHIEPNKSVVMLSYAPEGRYPNAETVLSKEAFIFGHATEYLGTVKPLVILNNYEANATWFPLRWLPDRDPFMHLADGPGFEGWLPMADFRKFQSVTGATVDYVITWCLTADLRPFKEVEIMQARLREDYDEVFVSDGNRIRLWRRR